MFKKEYWFKKDTGYGGEIWEPRLERIIPSVLIGIFIGILILVNFPFGTVSSGERGVQTRMNAVTGKVFGEGLYFKVPFIEKVVKMDVQVQKEEVGASAASKDLQTVDATIALNYRLDSEQVATIYRNFRKDYKVRLIDPVIQEAVKASTARFTAEELITKREEVREEIKRHLVEKLHPSGIVVEGVNIVNFGFSDSFDKAIEAKVTAEQDALASKNRLEQIKYEKEQAIVSAQGRAEALRIESNAISSNPKVLELRAIEKWNGVLPQVTGGATPFVNIN